MSDNEDKKRSLFSVDVIKKTEKVSEEKESEIGVEADIPIEDEGSAAFEELSSNLKPNENVAQPVKKESNEPVRLEIKEKKVQVFNISSGKVIKKDLSLEEKKAGDSFTSQDDGKIDKINGTTSHINKGFNSTIKSPQGEEFNKKPIIILVGVIISLIILYLIFSNVICVENKVEQNLTPVINYSK